MIMFFIFYICFVFGPLNIPLPEDMKTNMNRNMNINLPVVGHGGMKAMDEVVHLVLDDC